MDDAARLAGGAMGLMNDLSQQAAQTLRSHANNIAQEIDLVPREDYEALEAVVETMRKEMETLSARISELENKK